MGPVTWGLLFNYFMHCDFPFMTAASDLFYSVRIPAHHKKSKQLPTSEIMKRNEVPPSATMVRRNHPAYRRTFRTTRHLPAAGFYPSWPVSGLTGQIASPSHANGTVDY